MAAPFQCPFQHIHYLEGRSRDVPGIIVASAGSKLHSFSAKDGRKLFTWPPTDLSGNGVDLQGSENREETGGAEPPEKRRKISPPAEDIEKSLEEKNSESYIQENTLSGASWSTIPILVASPSGCHIVAVTAEDKTVRTFRIDADGKLNQMSQR